MRGSNSVGACFCVAWELWVATLVRVLKPLSWPVVWSCGLTLCVCSTRPFYCHCYSVSACHEQTGIKWSSRDCVAHPANCSLSSKFFFSHPYSLFSLLVTFPYTGREIIFWFLFPPRALMLGLCFWTQSCCIPAALDTGLHLSQQVDVQG